MSSPLGVPGLQQPDEIGRGGFGSVYRALEPEFDRVVAVKVIHDRVDDADIGRAFARECQAMGRLSGHPHIVTVHRGGTTEHGEPYIVMDLMEAGSLADQVDRDGPLHWPEVLDIAVSLAGALETAHRAGVLHLDVKPANVLVSRYGEPKLADFGISRLPGVTATTDGRVRASIAYAAPERLLDGTATPAADLYALGCTLYTLLVGEPAFAAKSGEDLVVAISRILRMPVPDLRRHQVPDPVARVIERLLAKSPLDRFATAAEAALALQAAQRATGRPVTRAVIDGAPGGHRHAPTWAVRPPAPAGSGDEVPPIDRPRYVPQTRPTRRAGAARTGPPSKPTAPPSPAAPKRAVTTGGTERVRLGDQAGAPAVAGVPDAPVAATSGLATAPGPASTPSPASLPDPVAPQGFATAAPDPVGAPTLAADAALAPPAPVGTVAAPGADTAPPTVAVPAPPPAAEPDTRRQAVPTPRPPAPRPPNWPPPPAVPEQLRHWAARTAVDEVPTTWADRSIAPPPPVTPRAAPDPDPQRPRWAGRPLTIAVAVVTVLGLGVGGGLLWQRSTATPAPPAGDPPATSAPWPTGAAPATPAPATPANPAPGPAPAGIAVAAGVNHPDRDAIADRLAGYLQAINDRDYATAFGYFAPNSAIARSGLAAFQEGNSTTAIQDQRLLAIDDIAGNRVRATVAYRSTQDAAYGPNGETCTDWNLGYELDESTLLIRRARALVPPQPC